MPFFGIARASYDHTTEDGISISVNDLVYVLGPLLDDDFVDIQKRLLGNDEGPEGVFPDWVLEEVFLSESH